MVEIRVGQVWRRKSDKRLATIERVDSMFIYNRRLAYRITRYTEKLVHDFVRQFEYVHEGDTNGAEGGQ